MANFPIVCCEFCNDEGRTFRNWDHDPTVCQWCDGMGAEVNGI
jgi:hypothetical protein